MNTRASLLLTALLFIPLAASLAADLSDAEKPRVMSSAFAATETARSSSKGPLILSSSSSYLTEGFVWAKRTALSKVHPDNGGCYQAALKDRGGYCQRDYVHQIDGAALLGLPVAIHCDDAERPGTRALHANVLAQTKD